MILTDTERKVDQKEFLSECLEVKNYFIQKTCLDLKGGEHGVTHITRDKFLEIFDEKFSRPSSLRQLVFHYKG